MSTCSVRSRFFTPRLGTALALLLLAGVTGAAAQTGSVSGTVTRTDRGVLGGVQITVAGTNIATSTDNEGRYVIPRIPAGQHVIVFRWLGYQPQQATVTVAAGQDRTVDITLSAQTISLGEIVVTSASKAPERIVEAPAAISVISPVTMRNQSITGQAPTVLKQVPGVDVVQSGMNDFNVNARGFNSSLTRRVLVMQDGRDLALAFLGAQEWNAISMPLEDMGRLEMVRGPGSALYGANAFAGVINIITPPARDLVGTKFSVGGGELSTMRADVRHAGVAGEGKFGYRVNLGYNRGDSWSRSRTRLDGSDATAEYLDAADIRPTTAVSTCSGRVDCLGLEVRPLTGLTADASGVTSGEADPVQNLYGSARVDMYADNGSIFTVEGGAAQVQNELFVTGIGRVQVGKATRPWARANWASDRFNVMAWYSGRRTNTPQYSLSSGIPLEETSALLHTEAQFNQSFADDQVSVVAGASYRKYLVDTKGTLMATANDDRNDDYYSGYGQVEYRPLEQLRIVGAARFDNGSLFESQFSPKAAVVYSPHQDHAFRASFNKAFMTPNFAEFFLQVPAGAPSPSPAALEGGIEGLYATVTSPAALQGLGATPAQAGAIAAAMQALNLQNPNWNFAPMTRVLALGNQSLDVEKVTGWEAGYKGNLTDRAYVSVDFYFNRLKDFVTDLLPAVNPAYPSYDIAGAGEPDVVADLNAVDAVLAALQLPANHPLRAGVAQVLAGYGQLAASPVGSPALATLPGGERAIVVSYANAGRVDEKGIEFGFGYGITPEFRVDASYTFFDFEVKDNTLAAAGNDLVPNTPQHKGSLGLEYTGESGMDFGIKGRYVEAFDWAAGVFAGRVASSQTIDANLGYRVSNQLRVYVNGNNLLDQRRFQLYGGSVIGRRILGGMTASF